MARKPRTPRKPAPAGYTDAPLERHGEGDETGMAPMWLAALDKIIPKTPTNLITLFNVIGPEWVLSETNERGRKLAEAAQNTRVAQLLGVNVRTVQRYRKGAAGAASPKAEIRGKSARKQTELRGALGPAARDVILRRFLSLAEIHGLAGYFAGAFYVSSPPCRDYARDGGVEGAEAPIEKKGTQMTEIIDAALDGQWAEAAWNYWAEWREEWGFATLRQHKDKAERKYGEKQEENWRAQAAEMDKENVCEVEEWKLALGYIEQLDVERGTGGPGDPDVWMFDEGLAKYEAGRPRLG